MIIPGVTRGLLLTLLAAGLPQSPQAHQFVALTPTPIPTQRKIPQALKR